MHYQASGDNRVTREMILVNTVIRMKIEDALPGAITGASL
jgi:hypothetical protein